jgi:hypothetical protein
MLLSSYYHFFTITKITYSFNKPRFGLPTELSEHGSCSKSKHSKNFDFFKGNVIQCGDMGGVATTEILLQAANSWLVMTIVSKLEWF